MVLLGLTPTFAGQAPPDGPWPLRFEPNRGQASPEVVFLSRTPDRTILLLPGEVVVAGPDSQWRAHLVGASTEGQWQSEEPQTARVNYLLGDQPAEWKVGIPTFGRVEYREAYPGIDIVFYSRDGNLEWDWVVKPGADPSRARIRFEGARLVEDASTGDLRIQSGESEVRLRRPAAYQLAGGRREKIASAYSLEGNEARIALGPYVPEQALIIDPVVVFSTTIGGGNDDSGLAIATDGHGNLYVTGETASTNFPVIMGFPNGYQKTTTASPTSLDAFVLKIDNSNNLAWTTYLGGGDNEHARAIAVTSSGEVLVAGTTLSTNFPLLNALQSTLRATSDGFVTRLNASGTGLVFSTYLGGTGLDEINGLALATDALYVGGASGSSDLPSPTTYQNYVQNFDGFVTKLALDGSSVQWTTYIGGMGEDRVRSIAVDPAGNVYAAGVTASTDLPTTTSAYQKTYGGGIYDGFLAVLPPVTTNPRYVTYLGAGGYDEAFGVATIGTAGGQGWSAYVAGSTSSMDFPVVNALYASRQGTYCGFVLNLTDSGMNYSTYFGGPSQSVAQGIAVDPAGNAYIAGWNDSVSIPPLPLVNATQIYGGNFDGFLAKLSPSGGKLMFSTVAGGSIPDYFYGIAVDASGNAYAAGWTSSSDYPTVSPVMPAQGLSGAMDVAATVFATGMPWAAFRDVYGSIEVTSPAGAVQSLGGVFANDPAVAQNESGDVFVVARRYVQCHLDQLLHRAYPGLERMAVRRRNRAGDTGGGSHRQYAHVRRSRRFQCLLDQYLHARLRLFGLDQPGRRLRHGSGHGGQPYGGHLHRGPG